MQAFRGKIGGADDVLKHADCPLPAFADRSRVDMAIRKPNRPPQNSAIVGVTTREWTRFWSYVDKQPNDGCWTWGGCLSSGYGGFSFRGRTFRAHRFAWLALVGDIAEGLHLDHLCRVRACVRPSHLEPVTPTENILRGVGATAMNSRKTHCSRGHAFTPDNILPKADGRACRKCARGYYFRKGRENRHAKRGYIPYRGQIMTPAEEANALTYDPWGERDATYRTLLDKFVKARKPSACSICFEVIPMGARVRAKSEVDGRNCATFRFCETCCWLMAHRSDEPEGDEPDNFEKLSDRYDLGRRNAEVTRESRP